MITWYQSKDLFCDGVMMLNFVQFSFINLHGTREKSMGYRFGRIEKVMDNQDLQS